MRIYHVFAFVLLIIVIIFSGNLIISELKKLISVSSVVPGRDMVSNVQDSSGNFIPDTYGFSLNIAYNTTFTFDLRATDVDRGDTLTFYTVSQPTRGKLELLERITNGVQRYRYTPASNYFGTDKFTFKVGDGKSFSEIATVSIVVQSPPTSTVTIGPSYNSSPSLSPNSSPSPSSTFNPIVPPQPVADDVVNTITIGDTYKAFTRVLTPPEIKPAIEPNIEPEPILPPVIVSQAYPLSVTHFAYDLNLRPAADRNLTLQQALDKYGAIRLDNKDYRTLSGSPASITVSGSQKIYGLPNTSVPGIIVSNASRAVLSRLRTGSIVFQGTTVDSTFENIMYAEVRARNAILERNLFLDFNYGSFEFDNITSGYLRNNRFIRSRFQSSSPQLVMKGDPTGIRASYGNVFIGLNLLTPSGDATLIENQDELTFVGIDAEAWNMHQSNASSALLKVSSGGVLNILGLTGGGGRSPIYDISSREVRAFATYADSSVPRATFRQGTDRLVFANSTLSNVDNQSGSTKYFRVMNEGSDLVARYNDNIVSTPLSAQSQIDLRSLAMATPRGLGWEIPTYEALRQIPTVSTVNWNTVADSALVLQGMIQRGEIIPAGVYYIKSSLTLDSNQMLWGSGIDRTIIIAPPSVDMVRSVAHRNGPDWGQARVVIGDVTLEGGRSGLRLDASGAGMYAQITDSVISHVLMRNMAEAGIWADSIYAMDNNFFDHVYIINSNTAVKQTPVAGCNPNIEAPGTTYLDKNFFYASQFIGNRVGFDLQSCRSNNSNYVINSLFKDNTTTAVRMFKNTSATFVNSDFIGNGGTLTLPTISNTVGNNNSWSNNIIVVGSRFDASRSSAVLGAHRMDVEGSVFNKGSNSSARVVAGSASVSFYNNRSDVALGGVTSGLFMNNTITTGSILSNPVVFMKNGAASVYVSGTSNPYSRFLVGSRM